MAIWNKKKIIISIAIAVWVTDLAFLIYGGYPLPTAEVILTSTGGYQYHRLRTGEFFNVDHLGHIRLIR